MINEHVKYRIDRAKETYADAVFLYERGSWNSCMNRLYYSAFYAAIAFLLYNRMEVKSHNGVKRKLGEMVVLRKLDKEDVKIFGVLSDFRNKGDYDDLFDFNKELVEPLLQPVKVFILNMEKRAGKN